MTLLDRTSGDTSPGGQTSGMRTEQEMQRSARQRDFGSQSDQGSQQQEQNVGNGERAVSVAAGAILALTGISRRSFPGILIAGVGAAMIHRGVTGHCYMYDAADINTADNSSTAEEISERGIHVEQAFLINRSPEDLYNYWRDFRNLPSIMSYLQAVDVQDDRRSHWVVKAPRIIGGKVEWDAEITADEPNSRIAWRSVGSADVDNAGEIRFSKAMGDRGTEVHVFMDYVPPAGKLGSWIASLLGENPTRVIREDLRRFKQRMEIGEIPTIIGQPHGTCTGRGRGYTESDWKPHFA
jgi:uncharacterized membrane protein